MIRRLLCAAFLLLAGCAAPAPGEEPAAGRVLLLDNATLIDGTGAQPVAGQSVLVEDGRIAAVYSAGSRPQPAGAEVIDLTGRVLIPGLIDAHVHLKSQPREPGMIEGILANALDGGVTTVRDMGGNGPELAALAQRADRLGARSPDILLSALFTGPASDFWMGGERSAFVSAGTPPGRSAWFRRLERPADAEEAVRAARAFGMDGIKAHSGMDAAMVAALGEAARRAGLPLWGHAALGPARPGDLVAAQMSVLSHADMLSFQGMTSLPPGFEQLPNRQRTRIAMAATPLGGEALARLFAAMRAAGACLEPTLFIMYPRPESAPDPAWPAYRDWVAGATARAHRAGVAICAGTDALGGGAPNLPAELELLVRTAGLTPLEAIASATSVNARALGLRDRGRIAPGLRADLVVLAADPSRDVAALRRVEAVFRGGTLHRPPPPGSRESD